MSAEPLSGALSELPALAELDERLAASGRATLCRVVEGADALLIATLHRRAGGATPTLALSAEAREAERLAADLEALADAPVGYFPTSSASRGRDVDARGHAQRLAILDWLASPDGERPPPIVVAALPAVGQPTRPPDVLHALSIALAPGAELAPEALMERLEEAGYEPVRMVSYRGEVARRGGIVDVFGYGDASPLRVEWFGDEVDSLRVFDPGTQVATGEVERARISLAAPGALRAGAPSATLLDYLPADAPRVVLEAPRLDELLDGASL